MPKITPIDNGFYQISSKLASKLCKGKLPKHGWERLETFEGRSITIARTITWGKQVWSVRGPGVTNLIASYS
jgi:hypothetical protein